MGAFLDVPIFFLMMVFDRHKCHFHLILVSGSLLFITVLQKRTWTITRTVDLKGSFGDNVLYIAIVCELVMITVLTETTSVIAVMRGFCDQEVFVVMMK